MRFFCAASLFVSGLASAKNMNGAPGQYKIANGDTSTGVHYQTDFQTEYFEVYSPTIKTRYSEVFWAGMPRVPLPDDILQRFANKTMAVVGYEVDQVQRSPNGEDIPVPITHAYNHHYCAFLLNSNKARLVKKKASEELIQSGFTHGSEDHWVAELLETNDNNSTDPLVQFISEANGGEMRLSYHGYPKGYAQLIYAPDFFHISPMQIDTWNRDEPSPKFKPGPLPRSSQIPPTAGFSGLLECPCSDRIERKWGMTYSLSNKDCKTPVQTQDECWTSAPQVTQASLFRHHSEANDKPKGCSLVQHSDGTTDVYWNDPHNSDSEVDSFLADDNLQKDKIAFASGSINITVAIKSNAGDADDDVVIMLVGPPDRWFGVGLGTNSMCLHPQSDQCPDGGPYTIIVQGDHVEERKLGYHAAGTVLEPTSGFKVHRNEIVSGNRTVVITRPKKGQIFSFDASASVPIIMARGCGMEFAQHCGHGPGQLHFLNQETITQICQAGIEGTIQGRKFNQHNRRCPDFPRADLKKQHNPTCKIETYRGGLFCCNHGQSLLDKDQAIPWADQYLEYHLKFRFYFEEYQPPASKEKEKESVSLRRSLDDMKEDHPQQPSHQNLVRLYWATEGPAGEYDLMQCKNSTIVPSSQCVQVITSRFQVKDMLHDCGTHPDGSYCTGEGSTDPKQTKGIHLIYAAPHCHAPSCLSVELYHVNTGQLLCRVEPIYGQSTDRVYDEAGYLALPPCLWGESSEGLAPPILLPLDAELVSIKRNNSTLPHTGEMALWQMRGVVVPREETSGIM